jgi:UDP-GlcNAc:undecaprenyl-phosphate GlcNAc-1-phosphate transferase
MFDYSKFIWIFLGTGCLSFLFSKLVIIISRRLKILDYPKESRKIHSQPTPLLGGLAIYFSFLIVILFLWKTGQLLDARMSWPLVIWFLLAGLVLMVNGLLDDKYGLSAKITIWGPLVASGLVILGGLKITYITHPDGGVLYLNSLFSAGGALVYFLPLLLTFLWLLGLTYTTKLLDGLDGLSSSIGLIASLVIFAVSLNWDVVGSTTSLLALALAGSLFGFLFLNWHPAKLFLGEGGSTFIGFSLGVLSIISGSKIATALLVMGLPVLDIVWVMVRRWRQGRPWWRGDQEHLHFRLLATGLSQRQVVVGLSLISLSFGLVSLLFTTKAKIGALLILLGLMFGLSSWLNYYLKKKHPQI